MRTNVLLMTFMALFLFGCSTSDTSELDLEDNTVTLSNSSAAKGPPETSGPIIREVFGIGFFILDTNTNLTALIGWDNENLWPPENMEPNMYQWSEINEFYLTGHGELHTLVFEGTPDWPLWEDCGNCDTWFDDATILATGMSGFSVVSTTNTLGDTFNGRLLTTEEETVMFHAMFKFNFRNGNYIESIRLH